MTTLRLHRAERLVAIKASAVNDALGELAQASEHLRRVVANVAVAETKWERALARIAQTSGSVADVSELYSYVRSLRFHADHLAGQAVTARADEEAKRQAVTLARMEHRKLELWRDGLKAAERAHAEKIERRASDEIAARTVRKTG